ncbi:hypothetical protein V1477_015610, partial [Vespula maculifrons]
SQCIAEKDLNQLRCLPTSFSTSYISSNLNVDLNRGRVFWSHLPPVLNHVEDERSESARVTGCNFLNKLLTSMTMSNSSFGLTREWIGSSCFIDWIN